MNTIIDQENDVAAEQQQADMEQHTAMTAPVAPSPTAAVTPMMLMERVVATGDMEKAADVLEKIMLLQERHEANEARLRLDKALSKIKEELPIIGKKSDADRYKYADLPTIKRACDPIIARHGVYVMFDEGEIREMAGVRMQKMSMRLCGFGAEKTVSREAPIDHKDGDRRMNIIQAYGSASTYNRRYLYADAFDLCIDDDDDASAGKPQQQRKTAPPPPPPKLVNGRHRPTSIFIRALEKEYSKEVMDGWDGEKKRAIMNAAITELTKGKPAFVDWTKYSNEDIAAAVAAVKLADIDELAE